MTLTTKLLYVSFLFLCIACCSGSLYKNPYQAWEYLQQQAIPLSSLGGSAKEDDNNNIIIDAVSSAHHHNHTTANLMAEIFSMACGLNYASLQELLSANILIKPAMDKNKHMFNLSERCENQTSHLLNSALLGEMWAMQMIDAWGKPQAGLLMGVLNWLGDYKECIGVRSMSTSGGQSADVLSYQGQYCTGVHNTTVLYNGQSLTVVYQLGMCVPSGCSEDDAVTLYDWFVKKVAPKSLRPMATCQPLPEEKQWSSGAIATYVVFGLMALVGLTAGLYDYHIHGTIMYYKVHRLPIPVKLLGRRAMPQTFSSRAHRLSPDDEGNLIQNPELDEDEQPQPRRHIPQSTLESVGLALRRFWLVFSFYSNGYKILTPSQPDGAINCLHGVRFLSLSWVILGHTLVFSMGTIASMQVIMEWLTRFSFQAIINASVSVDSFFMMSGLITAYLLLRTYSREDIGLKGFFKSVPVAYLHRYLRLTPALGFMLLFWIYGMYNFSSGPMWQIDEISDASCRNNSWATMFYVNNLYDPDHECSAWSWFLANDFQFFLLAPFLVGLLYWSEKIGLVVNVLLIAISCSCGIAISYKFDLGISLMNPQGPGGGGGLGNFLNGHWFSDYYVAPWVRYQSYGVGLIYGYIIWRTDGKLRLHWTVNLLLWAVSAALCLLPLYGAYNSETGKHTATVAENVIYNGLSRTSWCMGLGYLVLACHTGRGGFINELLSWRGFIPLSRMTYCAYLVHPVVMTIVTFSQQSLIQYTDTVYVYTFLSFMFLSYAVAFVFSLMFEAPFLNIDKTYITGALQKKKQ